MSGIFADSYKRSGLISPVTVPTGSTMSHQPPGGELIASTGASSHVPSQPQRSRSGTRVLSPSLRLSTSSRPIGTGPNVVSPGSPRVVSPPQPPPLPPPPPSPQLLPLKARLARSRSVSSHPTGSPLEVSDRATRQKWDLPTASSRRAAFGHNQSRSLKESPYDGSVDDELPPTSIPFESLKAIENVEPVPHSTPSVFLPINHPRERNLITVCLASLIFLSISVLITGLFSTVVLPLCLLACLIRRMGIWSAGLYQHAICCQCNRPQLRINSLNPFALFFSRLLYQTNNSEQLCQCLFHDGTNRCAPQTLRPLTPAELRWLPVCTYNSPAPNESFRPPLCNPPNTPLIMICLRFGAPGLELAKLREVIGNRLLKVHSVSSSLASNLGEPSLIDGRGVEQRQRVYSIAPPADTLSRLTQCLTCLSTGYAWRDCLAFRLEDHVVHVPATCLPNSGKPELPKSYRSSPYHPRGARNSGQQAPIIKVDSLVESLSELPLLPNRPLWQAYLLEQYQEVDDSEPSDADSAAETDETDHAKSHWPGRLFPSKRLTPNSSPSTDLRPTGASSSFVCRRSGSAGIGSLLVFRLHAVLSDDGKALVHLLTNCLTDLPCKTNSPSYTSSNRACKNDEPHVATKQPSLRRWRGQLCDGDPNQLPPTGLPIGNPIRPPTAQMLKGGIPTESKGNVNTAPTASGPQPLRHNPEISVGTTSSSQITAHTSPTSTSLMTSNLREQLLGHSEDEDPEEKEAAQWWYTFWSSSLATIATFCDLIRAVLTGPAIILHKYFFTRADMGILVKHKPITSASTSATPNNSSQMQTTGDAHNAVYKCMLLSLVKLSRIRQVTKASYSEIILSLLAGALRAYHQSVGLKHPPDLLAFLSVEVPVLPGCPLSHPQQEPLQHPSIQRCETLSITRSRAVNRFSNPGVPGILSTAERRQQQQPESLAEAGLVGNSNRIVAVAPPLSAANSLCPGRHVLADICLPLNTEGMLPRLWETRQRLVELNNSVDPLCLAWARTILYTLMPHPLANWLEATYGGSAKASVSVTGIDVVSPFNGLACQSKDQDRNQSYQMPPTRRLAYMSILAGKSAEARSLRRRLRKRLPRGASMYPPRLGTSFRALARHLTNANAGLVYVAGCPVVRIDTWMPSPRISTNVPSPEPIIQSTTTEVTATKWFVCRDLSVTFTTYAGQLSLAFSGTMASECYPNLDLIIQAMKIQLRNMCHLLAGRHVPAAADRWLHTGSQMESRNTATAAVNLSPSFNPNVVLRQESNSTPMSTGSTKPPRPLAPAKFAGQCSRIPASQSCSYGSSSNPNLKSAALEDATRVLPTMSTVNKHDAGTDPKYQSQLGNIEASNGAFSTLSTEKLQEHLRSIQQLLNDSAGVMNSPKFSMTEDDLRKLRAEFCTVIRELKKRCSTTGSTLLQDFDSILPTDSYKVGSSLQRFSGRNTLLQHYTDTSPCAIASICNRIPRCSTEFIMPLVKLAHAKGNGCEHVAPDCVHRSLSSGDFDEDPDFYIDGSGEEEDYEDELVDEGPTDSVISDCYATSSAGLVSAATRKRSFGFKYKLNDILHTYHNKHVHQKDHHLSQKHRRSGRNNVNCRRSSLLSADVGSLDITPNRRGSLGGNTSILTKERILYKLIRHKPADILLHKPESMSWIKV